MVWNGMQFFPYPLAPKIFHIVVFRTRNLPSHSLGKIFNTIFHTKDFGINSIKDATNRAYEH